LFTIPIISLLSIVTIGGTNIKNKKSVKWENKSIAIIKKEKKRNEKKKAE
jgi:hypothetical protein